MTMNIDEMSKLIVDGVVCHARSDYPTNDKYIIEITRTVKAKLGGVGFHEKDLPSPYCFYSGQQSGELSTPEQE